MKPKVVSKIRRTRESAYGTYEQWNEMRKRVLQRDNYKCKCGSKTNLEVHHIIPIARGGRTVMYNLITLCYKCHSRKHSHLR